ncbi:L-alanine-DL-glutamate epimerase-like enolase superfamily enzyme [Sagittula marina]|uniref:L-alanine-DL-glutamate epimerase-like enolase superfamily enzyme n=1 Tax=Sagittula marina TaxID=943940 RepID=A0A7W6GUF6_9RHOB|nr:mandelate racemase/muconate lactonizing enzyme family protein [Sagittula marina]MBB3988115.1 L-alanine-DL-glutamate epimerase-like enolase superfamily enzyme [Sagittula marina]
MACIARIEAWACRSPIAEPVATSFGIMRNRPAVFVRVEDDDGAFGWGEVFANWPAAGAEHRVNLLADDVAPLVLGQAADDPAALFQKLEDQLYIRALQCGEFGPFRQVVAGIDQALWDMRARREAVAVHVMLGASPVIRVPAYASGIHIDAADRVIPEARDTGFRAFKVKVGFSPDEAARVRALMDGLNSGEQLALDANQGWDTEKAKTFLDAVADLPLMWMEEPIRADMPASDWHRLAGRVPLAGGENIAGFADFSARLGEGVLSFVQPDIAKWGGFSGCLAVGRAALSAGATYCPHFLGAGIGLRASAELLATVGGPGLLEVDVNPNPLRDAFGTVRDSIEDGHWRLGPGPGLGVSQLPEAVAKCITHRREVLA